MKKELSSDETPGKDPYGFWDMDNVPNGPYDISKSYMQRLNILLRVQEGDIGLLLLKAIDMSLTEDAHGYLYGRWNSQLHDALDFIPRFDMSRAVNDTDAYVSELAAMAQEITAANNYIGSINPKHLNLEETDNVDADDADRLWSAIHNELYLQTENLLDMVSRVGYNVEGIRSQLFVRKMFEDCGEIFAKDLAALYTADLDLMSGVYVKRCNVISNIAEPFGGSYGLFDEDFNGLSTLLQDYNDTLHEMECAMFTRWIADDRHIELGYDTVCGIRDMDKIVEGLGNKILGTIETLSQKLPTNPYVAIDGDSYSDVDIDKMFDNTERAYTMLETLESNRTSVLYEFGLSNMNRCGC
ncbi:MAG: hypothetical protein KAI18_01480 [Candidatus Aenigmarchaeota archaeon]|nr:hypothetical protein [Candidatus Aenigmarchaeota archaeon]